MVRSIKKYIAVFTLLIIFALLVIQVRWIAHTVKFQEKVFQNTVTLALNQTIANLTENKRVCSMMKECIACDSVKLENQLTSAGVWEKIHEAVDSGLSAYDIGLKYELYIIKKGSDTLKTKEKEIRRGIYYSQCLQDMLQTSDYELVVRFPNRSKLFFAGAGQMFILSVVLILLIILSILFLLNLYQKELRLADNTKELINNISHEFKTPISSIGLAANMIRKDRYENNDKLREYATLIFKENKKLQHQVESLLHLAAIERNEFDYKKENTDIHLLIQEAVSAIEMFLWEKEGSVKTTFNATKSIIFADKLHVTNAIINLLSNAVKYSLGKPEISIRTKNSGQNIEIEVEDKGIGIPLKYQKFIFQKYYRVPTGDIHDIKGFGIGLSYVKKVVEAHEGEVKVESVFDEGSIFTVILPVNNG
jgi:two-component system, OmpR family, phosphate regulon sensor histidine kinase PhoR